MREKNRSQYEKYKRIIKFISAIIIIVLEVVIYQYVWMNYYNKNMTVAFWRRGNWLIIGEYTVLLLFLHRMYGGLKIGIYKYWNLVYSHMLSIIAVNVFSYVQVVLFDKKMHSPVAFIAMTLIDFMVVILWAFFFKKTYTVLFPKRCLLLVYGEHSMSQLLNRICTREDKFDITGRISINAGIPAIMVAAIQYEGIMLGDIPSGVRNEVLKQCYRDNIRVYMIPKVSDILLRSSAELNIFDIPLFLSRNDDGLTFDQRFFKRLEDVCMAGLLLILSSPFFLLIAALIKSSDGGPVFYTQNRITKNGQIFKIYKFRTMIVNAERQTGAVKAGKYDPRVLSVGRFLRATRLDELPQLMNILKGEMSLVGPRPERPELAEIITKNIPEFEYRLKVKAGLTGYAQIYGRYCTTSYDKLKLDLTYIRNYSMLLDLKLIFMTPKVLFMKESTDGFEEGKWEDPALRTKEK